jgi:hypothetical protein
MGVGKVKDFKPEHCGEHPSEHVERRPAVHRRLGRTDRTAWGLPVTRDVWLEEQGFVMTCRLCEDPKPSKVRLF